MSESTTSAQCTAWEWRAASKAGLMTREQGTNAFDEAVHRFAEDVREGERAKSIKRRFLVGDVRGSSSAFEWWRSEKDRRYFFIDTTQAVDDCFSPAHGWIGGRAVIDDFGNLVRVRVQHNWTPKAAGGTL